MPDKQNYTFYLSPTVHHILRRLADKDRRSISGQLAWLVEQEQRRRRDKEEDGDVAAS